jgi:hypothetical protein
MIRGKSFEGFYETSLGPIIVESRVEANGHDLFFRGLTFYPASGTFMPMSVGEGVRIFHAIMDEARELGFETCSIEAFRIGGRNPGRMLRMTRRLR